MSQLVAVSREANESPASTTPNLRELVDRHVEVACQTLGRADLLPNAARVLDLFAASWGAEEVGHSPLWQSDITDDGSPFELSVAYGDTGPELRILAERQCAPFTAESGWTSGLALNAELAAAFAVDLSRFALIRDIFAPCAEIPVRFSMWHAVTLRPEGAAPEFKVYLNPQVAGAGGAKSVVERALSALGLQSAWRQLAGRVGSRAEYVYFSLDLSPGTRARVKVYVTHPGADAQQIAEDVGGAPAVSAWIRALSGTSGALSARPVQTCYAFRAGVDEHEVTTYVPVRSYVEDDAEAVARACAMLSSTNAAQLQNLVHALADRPLEAGRGLLTYVGVRGDHNRKRVTVYLSPQVYAIASARRHSVVERPPALSEIRSLNPACGAEYALRAESAYDDMHFADIQQLLEAGQAELASHAFLLRLQHDATYEVVLRVAPKVAFFVMCFQDVLRLVHEKTSDPALKALARVHEQEDKGHDLWYLNDLEHLGLVSSVSDIFSSANRAVRDIVYTQVSDALRARDDRSRLGIVLALEAAGTVFFGRMIACLERLKADEGLRYFARKHQQVEENHDIFSSGPDNTLESMVVPASVVPEFIEVVQRTFATMSELADTLYDCSIDLVGPCGVAVHESI